MVRLPLEVAAVRADQAMDGVLHLLSDAHCDEPSLIGLIVRVGHRVLPVRLLTVEGGQVVRARLIAQ